MSTTDILFSSTSSILSNHVFNTQARPTVKKKRCPPGLPLDQFDTEFTDIARIVENSEYAYGYFTRMSLLF